MKIWLAFALTASFAAAQTPDPALTAIFKQQEKAVQTGDPQLYLATLDRQSRVQMESAGPLQIRPRPEMRYRPIRSLVQGTEAILIGQIAADSYVILKFIREDGAWKIADQSVDNREPDARSMYAALPPPDGSFARAGSPWQNVPQAKGIKLQATRDETYLYIRITADAPLPAPGSETPGSKMPVDQTWPVMKLRIGGPNPREYRFDAATGIGDRATFDEKGKANSHFPYLTYMFSVWKGDDVLFHSNVDLNKSRLISVTGSDIDIRIPLKALGVDASATPITLIDANSAAKFQPYEIRRTP